LDKSRLDDIQKDILNKCNFIEPRYIPVIEPALIEGRDVLVLWISGGDDRPYKCPVKIYTDRGASKSEKAYYIRKGSNTIRANTLEERELISLARNIPFDDRVNPHAKISDMRSSLISEYLHAVDSELYVSSLSRTVEDVARDMRLIGGPPELRKPINVGLMFFNERPDAFFPYSQIEVVDKPDPTGIGMRERIFTGPLDRQLRDALSYIKNYVIAEYVTKVPNQAEAIRVFNWPYRAVEEALSNAIYHRSYQIHEPITVTITPERMEILSLPGPDRSITDHDLENRVLVSSRYRNRRIGDFLKELKLVEGRNTGIPLILREMQNNGSDLPVFKTDAERSYFRVILPIHSAFLENDRDDISRTKVQQRTKRRNREELRQLIIETLRQQGNLSMGKLAVELGYKSLNDTLRSVINEMLEDGDVRYLYPDKMNSRNQKICLNVQTVK
jgi:ATP-dependent DNA helicase RecG